MGRSAYAPKPVVLPEGSKYTKDENGLKVLTPDGKVYALSDEREAGLFEVLSAGEEILVTGTLACGIGRITFLEDASFKFGRGKEGTFKLAKILRGSDLRRLISKGEKICMRAIPKIYKSSDDSYHIGIDPVGGIEIIETGKVVTIEEAAQAARESGAVCGWNRTKEKPVFADSSKEHSLNEKTSARDSASSDDRASSFAKEGRMLNQTRTLRKRFETYKDGFNPKTAEKFETVQFTRKCGREDLSSLLPGFTCVDTRLHSVVRIDMPEETLADALSAFEGTPGRIAKFGDLLLVTEHVLFASGTDEFGPYCLPAAESEFTAESFASLYGWQSFITGGRKYFIIPDEESCESAIAPADAVVGPDGCIDTCEASFFSKGRIAVNRTASAPGTVPVKNQETDQNREAVCKDKDLPLEACAAVEPDKEEVSSSPGIVQYILMNYRYSVPRAKAASIEPGAGHEVTEGKVYKKSISSESILKDLSEYKSTVERDGDDLIVSEFEAIREEEDGTRVSMGVSEFDAEEVCRLAGLRIIMADGHKQAVLKTIKKSGRSKSTAYHTISLEGPFEKNNTRRFKFCSSEKDTDEFSAKPIAVTGEPVNMFSLLS